MKRKFCSSYCCQVTTRGLLLVCAALLADSIRAANPVLNPGFESPFVVGGVTNWSVVYVLGGPDDFAIKDRTTAARRGGSGTGAAFKPYHDAKMHAYFKQTVPGLTPGAPYAVTAWMNNPVTPKPDGFYTSFSLFLETVGGLGSVTSASPTYEGYQAYTVTNTANASGQIEIRLHFNKFNFSLDKWYYTDAWYDDVSVTAIATQPLPFRILSFTLAGSTATFLWESISNQTYRILSSPNLSTWTTFQSNLLATGPTLTFTTNVYPTFNNPQFFRIAQP